ncbi:hypothetical protein SCP_0504620 [Sparassis crispa]|uniref:Uncharacterized protein n=1 Tax=Sparassis crispa TaxID=139825 RepID=A0A401GNU0_9APHY|nr:hypothetical protein SCP_0504620 [Sparassis crispa]GBE83414.1 hypothetical protein SCP_0504620 [Sparassis crispa]
MYQVPLVSANLATVPVQSFFYGVFFLLFVTSTYNAQLSVSDMRSVWRNSMFSAGIEMFLRITGVRLFRFKCRIDEASDAGASPLTFYSDLAPKTKVVGLSLADVTLAVGDAALVIPQSLSTSSWNYHKRVAVVTLLIFATSLKDPHYGADRDVTIFRHVFGRW